MPTRSTSRSTRRPRRQPPRPPEKTQPERDGGNIVAPGIDAEKDVIDAFRELESSVERILAGESGLRRDALARVFNLNTRIGRIYARDAARRAGLKRLQLAVNGITAAIKREDAAPLRESLESTRNEIRDVFPR